MTKSRHRTQAMLDPGAQMLIAFMARRPLDDEQRAAVVKLLSQLLLKVAMANRDAEVADDRT